MLTCSAFSAAPRGSHFTRRRGGAEGVQGAVLRNTRASGTDVDSSKRAHFRATLQAGVSVRTAALSLAVAACLPGASFAQTYRESIVVTGERIETPRSEAAAAVTVLTRADLEKLPVETLADVLRFVPG